MERDFENGGRISMLRIAILSPTPDYEENWSAIKADYQRLFGDDTAFLTWTDCGDLSGFDLVTPLLAWGYPRDYCRWLSLLDRLETAKIHVANPVRVLRWNSDKAYLAELATNGIATVPTIMTEALGLDDLKNASGSFATQDLVIKPPISGGAEGTYKLTAQQDIPETVLGKRMMIQPFLPTISAEGEYSLFYFDGVFSHAILKSPAKGDFRVQDQFGGTEVSIEPPECAMHLAQAALSAALRINATPALPYARVDMLRDAAGNLRLMELELIEPSLFLRFAKDKGAAFAASILRSVPPL
jgi:glutathione synthase/RimK-type ligase-like ATP-grasp enzyme